MEPQLGGIVASRDVVFHNHVRKIGEASFISLCSTEWPGMQSEKKNIRWGRSTNLIRIRNLF
jgi:hypothetical protein